ncbi:MAG: helix-turn-helix transcriptional regulator [Oscillospiraceae bacterium]|nr:helix-turn-helix transcriptional regulator [Oscillospiraceae bacterium]
MIQNLNKQSFSSFGKILRDSLPNRGLPKGDEWVEMVGYFSADDLYLYRAPCEVYLDFEIGMTILAVRRKGKNVYFYLDKPVCLTPETEYAVIPYQEECSVRMALPKGVEPEKLGKFKVQENFRISDRLHLGEIYTLFYREEESGFLFKGESHSMYELTYVDRGQLHCVVEGNGYTLKQGQLMFFTPNQWHMQYTDLNVTARFLTVAFDFESNLPISLSNRVFDLSSAEAVYLKQLLAEIDISDDFSSDFIRSNLKLLLLSVLRDSGGRKKRLKTPLALRNENIIVSRTLRCIAEHVYDKLTVDSVAREVSVSTSHLTALFHRQMNISPGEYIRRVKLEESKALIREGKMNFSQIAAALNYSTIHHFSRQFKDNFGISPSEYAKSLRDE